MNVFIYFQFNKFILLFNIWIIVDQPELGADLGNCEAITPTATAEAAIPDIAVIVTIAKIRVKMNLLGLPGFSVK